MDNSIGVDDAYGDAVVSYPTSGRYISLLFLGANLPPCTNYEPELTFMRQVDDSHYYVVFNAEGRGSSSLLYARPLKMEGLDNVTAGLYAPVCLQNPFLQRLRRHYCRR